MTKIFIAFAMLIPLWVAIMICGHVYGWDTDLPLWINCIFSAYFGAMTALAVCGAVEIIIQ